MAQGLPASWPDLEKEMTFYQEEPLVGLYEDIFKIWYRMLDWLREPVPWEKEQISELLRQGRFLLNEKPLHIDPLLYREVLEQVVAAAVRHFPEAKALSSVPELPGLAGDNLELFLLECASFDGERMQQYLQEQQWDQDSGVEPVMLAFLFFSALTPFYVALAQSVSEQTDFSLWQEGFCPVCGQKPGMAQLRDDDGARVLECWLCHTQWQFPRLECPFCHNREFDGLHFFYTDEYPGRRVQLCERCKSYLKTVAVKEIGRNVILELENIYTIQLDILARREGYRPGEDLAVLI